MKKENLDKIIDRVRAHLYEDAPTMNTASADGKPGFSSKADALGPTAGYDAPLKRKRKKYIYVKGVRKLWSPKNGRAS
jgi:hypothetical protein|tara:strand:+ start:1953 stop:2186 length:234 start_codon:yes stop_codon:yes gene_type:complete